MSFTAAEAMTYSTLPITTFDSSGIPTSTATGFVFAFLNDPQAGTHFPALVTNRHVLKDAASIEVIFTLEKEPGVPATGKTIAFHIPTAGTLFHPNQNIDLAVMPLGAVLDALSSVNQKAFYSYIDSSLIPTEDDWKNMNAIERVVMAGYPKGIRDEVNNQPIVRSGITATHPALDFRGLPEFLVDMPCFEGCSGSPVFIMEEGFVADPRTGGICVGGNRIFFLGVQRAIQLDHTVGELAVLPCDNQPLAVRPVTQTYLNLGYIIKSSALLDFEPIIRSNLGL